MSKIAKVWTATFAISDCAEFYKTSKLLHFFTGQTCKETVWMTKPIYKEPNVTTLARLASGTSDKTCKTLPDVPAARAT